jgi:hypothetical protein
VDPLWPDVMSTTDAAGGWTHCTAPHRPRSVENDNPTEVRAGVRVETRVVARDSVPGGARADHVVTEGGEGGSRTVP